MLFWLALASTWLGTSILIAWGVGSIIHQEGNNHMSDIQILAANVRPLPVALAHCLAITPFSAPRYTILSNIYINLSWQDKLRCRAELNQCRRGKTELGVVT
jgi:hypothetical protein